MSTPLFSIGGLASGLDTADIVQQLMALERQPMVKIQQRQETLRRTDQVWSGVVTRLSNLRSAVDGLRDPAALANTTKVTSSDDAVATATRTAAARPGQVAFTVQQLATHHRVAAEGTFSSAGDVLGAGSITLARHGAPDIEVELGEGATLQDAARALNAKAGISASVLRTGDAEYRLVIDSDTSGEAARFELSSTYGAGVLDGGQVLSAAQDAVLTMGDPDLGGLTITRSTNTIDDLVEGVEVRLTGVGDVQIGIQQDVDAAAKKVTGLVEQLNGVLDHLATVSKTSAEVGERGPLASDPLVRSLQLELRGALSQVTGEGTFRTLNQIGIELTREGRVKLDETRLREALTADPQAVGELLGRLGGSSDERVNVTATGGAQAGEYQVAIDTASRVATATGATFVPPTGDPKTYSIKVNGKVISVTAGNDEDTASVVRKLNQQLALESINVRAVVEDDATGAFGLEATRAGAGGNFTIADPTEAELTDLGLDGSETFGLGTTVIATVDDAATAGRDAIGTVGFGGETWEVSGGRLMVLGDGPGSGLQFTVPSEVTGNLGVITVSDGLAGVLDRVLQRAEGRDGSIARAREAIEGRIKSTGDSLGSFERRLELRERTIRRQFTAMEEAMARFQAQGNWLASQLGSMMGTG